MYGDEHGEHRWVQRGQVALDDPTTPLLALLTLVADGIQHRRSLDESVPDAARRDSLVRVLSRLQYRAIEALAKELDVATTDAAARRIHEIAEMLDGWLRRDEAYAAHLLSHGDADSAGGMFRCDAFHADLQWYAMLAAYLEREPEPDRAFAIKARLDHLVESLADGDLPPAVHPSLREEQQRRRERIRQDCRVLEREYLDDRIADEIDFPTDDASPVSLWNRRLQLSRLEADRAALGLPAESRVQGRVVGEREPWLARLESRQEELAHLAEERLLSHSAAEQLRECRELAISAQEESNDTLTLVEDLPLWVSVELLRSSVSDLRRLAKTGRRVDRHGRSARDKSAPRNPLTGTAERLARRSRDELQEKKLALRMERLFGPRIVTWLENTILLLILVFTVLIVSELVLESMNELTPGMRQMFAWTDLAVCSVFLSEFFLKMALVEGRARYFRRHFLIDFVASIPFGFVGYQIGGLFAGSADQANLLRLLRFLRLPQVARYARPAQQIVRFGRLLFFLLRTTDRLVLRHAHIFNRNIVLFEPNAVGYEDPGYRVRLARLREHFQLRVREIEETMSLEARIDRASLSLADLRARYESLPTTALHEPAPRTTLGRDIPAEEVVRELVEMTPERLVQRMGPGFPNAVVRYVRYFDLPLVRRLPVLSRLVAARDRGSGEVAALAANYLGFFLQWILNVGYFFADLQGTISGPIFLDRLGTLLVSATARNAKRLILFGSFLVILYAIVRLLGMTWLEGVLGWVKSVLGQPLLILGGICLVVMLVGRWLRSIASQTSEEGERLVEAQFAAQTKALKTAHASQDLRFLADRVVAPELVLRSLDDPDPLAAKPVGLSADELIRAASQLVSQDSFTASGRPLDLARHGEELVFLRNVALLHLDYVDSGLFRPTDTKTTTQLLGNLALSNLKRTSLATILDGRKLRSLDLSRSSGSLFGGPYLWFHYMTRIVTEETAKLIVDFNRNAIPLSRLACSSAEARERYRSWLAKRLGIAPSSVPLPQAHGEFGNQTSAAFPPLPIAGTHRLESIDFTTMDFLSENSLRDAEIEQKFGPMVLRLLKIDRRRGIRRAFRSFPLHRYPPSQRTFNPFTIYLDYFSGGRVLLLPPRLAWWTLRGVGLFFRQTYRTVRDVLDPPELPSAEEEDDSYAIALRKIHRMRKPGFLAALWLRARLDIEYAGVPVPGVPLTVGSPSLLEDDLNFVGSTRRERLAAEQIVLAQRRRIQSMEPTLRRLGFDVMNLPPYLAENFPPLTHRAAEVQRALATAWAVDFEGIYSLATAIDGLRQVIDHAADPAFDGTSVPDTLPGPISRRPPGYKLKPSSKWSALRVVMSRLGRQGLDETATRAVVQYIRRHWPLVRGWVGMILAVPPDRDPVELAQAQIREVILHTDLWSDQIVILRTLQSLTVLDVHHYCRMVWSLGGYGDREAVEFPARLPASSEPFDWSTRVSSAAGA